jgi:hypothetical protein
MTTEHRRLPELERRAGRDRHDERTPESGERERPHVPVVDAAMHPVIERRHRTRRRARSSSVNRGTRSGAGPSTAGLGALGAGPSTRARIS